MDPRLPRLLALLLLQGSFLSIATARSSWEYAGKARSLSLPLSEPPFAMDPTLPRPLAQHLPQGSFLSIATARSSWEYCDDSAGYSVSVQDVVVRPDPVNQGAEAVFEVYASASEIIQGGKLVLSVSYFGIPVYKKTFDLCTKIDDDCPAGPGNFKLSNRQVLSAPIGSYRLEMRMLDDEQSLLACVRIKFSVVKSDSQVE